MPEPLLDDDLCRNCYHAHATVVRSGEKLICAEIAEDPGPDGPVYSVCCCADYVDLNAESRIIVRLEQHDA